ncbi:MAG: gamma-glutamyltransferase, partial [Xanthomonadales bacterium]|nr:gamma-glutamyltransferase [Xanthomonadales bacterium]
EPAGSGIAGQVVMLIKAPGQPAQVINGATRSPRRLPAEVRPEQLKLGRSAAAVPSAMRVLDLARRRFGSGRVEWPALVAPAERIAREGFVVGPFRARAFHAYREVLAQDPATAAVFLRPDGRPWQAGEVFRQPLLADTLARIAQGGAQDFYAGELAREIVADMAAHGGWITAEDLARFPEPPVVPALAADYRGARVETLPPPFGGWVMLQALKVLEQGPADPLATPGPPRDLRMLDALRVAHGQRRSSPLAGRPDALEQARSRVTGEAAAGLLRPDGGETTHFSVVDGDGLVVSVTQSIDSYFGAGVMHPQLGFLYNNYMQGFQVDDPDGDWALAPDTAPKSSMSATVVSVNDGTVLALGSPGSARIISAVAQVISHWLDVGQGIEQAVAAYRVHVVPPERAYIEQPDVGPELLAELARRGYTLVRPDFGVAEGSLDPYFGGVHAVALEHGAWVGSADPRRDGRVGYVTAGRAAGSGD